MRRRSTARFPRWLLPAALAAAALPPLPAPAAEPAPAFLDVLEERFPAWDADGDGVLEEAEVDALVVKPAVSGREAAAAATLKVLRRKVEPPLPAYTLGYFTETRAWDLAPANDGLSFDRTFRRYGARIASIRRRVFADEPPSLGSLHQGDLGDCFFLASLGALLHRDPGEVTRMVRPAEAGAVVVDFPGAKPVTVDPPTDAEIAMGATSDDRALWPVLLELAVGNVRSDALPEERQPEEATDTIARGGIPSSVLPLLTGHATRVIATRGKDPSVVLPALRDALREAVPAKRLVVASSRKEMTPVPGLHAKHSYAVIGYDADSDTIRLWDPHGHTHKPAGPPGPANGWPVAHGIVEIPLPDLVPLVRTLSFETSAPAR